MLLNVDQLQKQLNKDEFQKDGSMAAFWVVNNEFQKFIDSQFSLDYDSQMTEKYFDEYTGIEVKQFKDTLLQHMGNVKKFVDKRTRHQRQYNRRVNKRQMQMQESKIDMGKVVDVDLVVTESSGTESEVQDDSSMSENDTDADNAYIRPIYDEEPMAEALKSGQHGHILNEISNKAKIKKEIDAYETINIELEHSVAKLLTENEHLNKENETVKKHYKDLYDSIKIMRSKTIELTTSLLANNVDLKAQIQEKVVPTGKILASCTSKDDSESTNGSNVDIPNIHKCKQTLDLSAGTSINVQKEQGFDLSAVQASLQNVKEWCLNKTVQASHLNVNISSYSRHDSYEINDRVESLFGPLFDEYFNGENQVISKSSTVTTIDASDKRQQQPDSTSSTSNLVTSVTADGNFDM
ncbi:hypothetical protein Tco_0995218 [Tanacetum coccineum]